ncbi:Uncharacterised protein [Klebsiella pneumoniae]|nr:Uncharacterised protein [Klebsiella pneumoniae]
MMSLWDALRMNMMISYQELVRTFPKGIRIFQPVASTINNRARGTRTGGTKKMRCNIVEIIFFDHALQQY